MAAYETRVGAPRSSTPAAVSNGRLRPADNFYRGLTAQLLSRKNPDEPARPELLAAKLWPDDRVTPAWIQRSAVGPANTTTAGWAAELVRQSFPDTLLSMAAAWASAALYKRSLQLTFSRRSGAIRVPTLRAAPALGSFVAEGAPIPVSDATVGGVTLLPKKVASLVVFTRELFEYGVANLEAIVRSTMQESLGLVLDGAMFSADAATAEAPAGLRNGIAATAAATGTPFEAMMADLGALLGAVSAVAGNAPVVIIAAPAQAAQLSLWLRDARQEVLASSALANGVVLAIATAGLVFVLDPQPDFSFGEQSTLHMADTPLPISAAGTPNTVATPVRSMLQTDSIALRMIMRTNWALRSASAVAWTESTNW